ncbi:hypothetical protein [Bartonella sp. CB175]|uniref:hypothetical protein n=1 Tax=Bartonella sp. CB175 TaxID=3112256 RepID=UPI00300DE8DA
MECLEDRDIETFSESCITKTESALTATEARRILNPSYPTKLQTLEQKLTIFGKQVVIIMKDIA